MKQKKCCKCGDWKDITEFGKCKSRKDGLHPYCKQCRKKYYENNKEHVKKYKENNKEHIQTYNKKYKKDNTEKTHEYNKEYNKNNAKKLKKHRKKYYNSNAKYEKYKDKLTITEKPRLAENGVSLEVKCRYCGKYFIPTNQQVKARIRALNKMGIGELSLYCSEGCKYSCPIFGKILYIRGNEPATSREVQPELRQMVLKRDNYTCQKCGKTIDEIALHCHHIYPLNESPITSADVDECINICVDCHKKVHQKIPGCGYYEMRCSE